MLLTAMLQQQEEIPAITYNSGGTYTLGALMQAVEVLQVKDYRQLSATWNGSSRWVSTIKQEASRSLSSSHSTA